MKGTICYISAQAVYTSYTHGLHSHNWLTRWTILLLQVYLARWT